ncbi:MAG: GIY-YIG nuclease family protein [Bacteroidota bacterium]
MKWFVYIIQSQTKGILYKGCTSNVEKRLYEHTNDLGRFTKGKGPWKIVFLKEFDSKREALIYERMIKRANSDYLKNLIEKYRNSNLGSSTG